MLKDTDWIVFDFDGTIADSFKLAHRILNQLARKHGFRPVADHEVEMMRHKTMLDFFTTLGISMIKLPILAMLARREIRAHIADVPPISGISEALQTLKGRGYRLGILTSNAEENVQAFLSTHGLQHLFEFVHCSRDIFGKAHRVKALMRKYRFSPERIVYVGDMDADVEAARQSGIRVVAVTWGYQAASVLEKRSPTWLIDSPNQLAGLFGDSTERTEVP